MGGLGATDEFPAELPAVPEILASRRRPRGRENREIRPDDRAFVQSHQTHGVNERGPPLVKSEIAATGVTLGGFTGRTVHTLRPYVCNDTPRIRPVDRSYS